MKRTNERTTCSVNVCQAVPADHTTEGITADNAAATADENAQDENNAEADDDSEDDDDDDDIQVTIGDIKQSYELVHTFDKFVCIDNYKTEFTLCISNTCYVI